MAEGMTANLSLRPLQEDDLPTMFEIQLDEDAQYQAALVAAAARDREAYLARWRRLLLDKEIITRAVELDGDVVGSVGIFPLEGDLELTYWIRRDVWGRGVATAAVAALLEEVTARPLRARVVQDNVGSIRVLERNGFVRVGSEEAFAEGRQATVTELIYRLEARSDERAGGHAGPVSTAQVLMRVRELRAGGLSPKQVARELGLMPAELAPLLRQVAGAQRAQRQRGVGRPLGEPGEREVVGCWVTPGWSAGLGLDPGLDQAREWAAADPQGHCAGESPAAGLVGVMVARADRSSRVTVCGWLVDVFCLGIKNAMGPKTMSSSALFDHSRQFFSVFDTPPRAVALELAQHLVHGAAAYAASFGFEPHPDFADTVPYLGTARQPCPIRFGRDGVPFSISGPRDNPREVIAALEATAGTGKYHYIAGR